MTLTLDDRLAEIESGRPGRLKFWVARRIWKIACRMRPPADPYGISTLLGPVPDKAGNPVTRWAARVVMRDFTTDVSKAMLATFHDGPPRTMGPGPVKEPEEEITWENPRKSD